MKVINQKGMALVLVIMVMFVLTIFGVTLLTISLAEKKQIAHQDKRMQAYYLAKSGADTVASYILKNPKKAQELIDAGESNTNSQLSNGTFKVDAIPISGTNDVKVKATGYVGGIENTTNVIIRRLSFKEILDKTIYTNSDLDIQEMVVTGDIQSGGSIKWGANYTGTAYPYEERCIDNVNPFYTPSLSAPDYEVKNKLEEIDSSTEYSKLSIANNGILNIIANDKTIIIKVNELDIKGRLNIYSTGKGIVEIYVNNSITVTTNGIINNTHPKNLFVYLNKDSIFHIQANMDFNGYIFGPEATVMIQSAKSTINGAIFSDIMVKNKPGEPGGHGIVHYVELTDDSQVSINVVEYRLLRWEK